ncbi:MAG: ribosome maturation factor RimM [Gammaproteobacteria bacterium]|nr:ribosome maturation factor RimM [Gammaproteobacteria bacterium]
MSADLVIIGKVGAPHGIRGWVSIHSSTQPRENILDYLPWFIKRAYTDTWQEIEVIDVKGQQKLLALFAECADRTAAEKYVNAELAIPRDRLPVLAKDEYYWSDLTGLTVTTTEGRELGKIDHLFATGANDVLVIKGEKEYLVPYVKDRVVKNIDLKAGTMTVDWDPDF